MACKRWNVEWVAHLYGELGADEERRLSEHLDQCADCREELERLESSRRALGELAASEPAAPRVVVLPQRRAHRPGWAFAAGLACASVLFAVGAVAGSYWSSPSGPPDTASLEERFHNLERSLARAAEDRDAAGPAMTRPQVEEALLRLQHRLELEQARNTQFLLEEINATEFRAGRWVDETRQAIQFVALQNDPRFRER